eukprot:PhM_4_TR11155/c0_g1_i1/m.29007
MADDRAIVEMNLKMKFRSLNYNRQRVEQRLREVSPDKRAALKEQSYSLWKRLNPGYMPDDIEDTDEPASPETVTRGLGKNTMMRSMNNTLQAAVLERGDAHAMSSSSSPYGREHNRKRDKHTEYVEYVVRDQALARGHK